MLKTHANELKSVIISKESRVESLKVNVIPGSGRKDFRVLVKADEMLINKMMSENASGEYLDNDRQKRRRLDSTMMEFY